MAPKMNKSDWYDSDSDTLAESVWPRNTKNVSNKHKGNALDQKVIRLKGFMIARGSATSSKQPSWTTAEIRDLPFDDAKLKQMVEAYHSRTGSGLAHNYKNLMPNQQRAVNRCVDEQKKKETNSRVEWTLEYVHARMKKHTWGPPETKSIEVILKSQQRPNYNNGKANVNNDFLSYVDDDYMDFKVPTKKTKGIANTKVKTAKGVAPRAMPGPKVMQNVDFSSDYDDYPLPKDPYMMPAGVGPKAPQNFPPRQMNPGVGGPGPSFGPNQGGQPNFNNLGQGPGLQNLPANAPRPMGGPNGPVMNGPPGPFPNGPTGNPQKVPPPTGMYANVPMGPSLNAGPLNAGPPTFGPPNVGQAGSRMGPAPNTLPPGAIHINDFPGGPRTQGPNGPQPNQSFERPFVNQGNNGFNSARPPPQVNYPPDRFHNRSPEYRSGRDRSRSYHDRYDSRSRDRSRNRSRDRSYRRRSHRDDRSRTRSRDRSTPRRRDATADRRLRRIEQTMDNVAGRLDALDINDASDTSSYRDSVFDNSSAYHSTPGTTPELAPRSLDGGRGRRLYTKASRPHFRRVLIEPAASRGHGLSRTRRTPAYVDYQPARPQLQRRMTVSGQPTVRPRVHKVYDVDDYPYEAIEGPRRRGSLYENDAWAPPRTREREWRRGEVVGQPRYYV